MAWSPLLSTAFGGFLRAQKCYTPQLYRTTYNWLTRHDKTYAADLTHPFLQLIVLDS